MKNAVLKSRPLNGWIPFVACLVAVLAIAHSAFADSAIWYCNVPCPPNSKVTCGSNEEGCCCRPRSGGPWKCMCLVPTNPLFVCAGTPTYQCL